MVQYTLAVGIHDPQALSADNDAEAIRRSVGYVLGQYTDDMKHYGQEVVTLLGPDGLITRPSERLDEFMRRVMSADGDNRRMQPGDTNTPDCNGD